jgi:hypothetical protein
MKIKTAYKIFFTYLFFLLSLNLIDAQEPFYVTDDDVIVSANIDTDLYTQLSLNPSTVEIRQPSTVNITALDSSSTPRASREIIIYISGVSTGITIVQPPITNSFGQTSGLVSSSVPGTYTVCAKDVTEGYDILILDCETLYVTPVPTPVMVAEPQYTKSTKNIVMWTMSGSGVYTYYTESAFNDSFSSLFANSNWITNLLYEFTGLQDAQMYFYRVKARNTYGGESAWSNTVFSLQDASGPQIDLISISDVGENNTSEWDEEYSINIKYRIKDNIGISSREFWCLAQDGSRYDCDHTASVSGDFWNISVKLKDLERLSNGNLLDEYQFCVEAKDIVLNVTRNCEAKFSIPPKLEEPGEPEEPEEPTEPEDPVIPVIPKTPIIERIKKKVEDVIRKTVGNLEPTQLQDITVTTATANIAVNILLVLTSFGYLPYIILQIILALLSLLGFRKRGNPSGYVYNSLTKEPITQAIVRIFNENNELIWTDVTDSNGYFKTTEVEDGEYYIKVTARNSIFPSKVVFGKTDFPLENVYHGEEFLTRNKKIPNFSIPMDQKEITKLEKSIAIFLSRTKSIWKSLHILLFLIGLLFSIYALHITQMWWNYLIVIIYIPSLIALIFSFFNKKEKYGTVKDENRKPVEGAIIGLYEKEFDKLVSKRVTNNLGRYKFVVSKGLYKISIMNSDLKVQDAEKIETLEVKKEGVNVLCPNITVKRLEDSSKGEEIKEPLKEL